MKHFLSLTANSMFDVIELYRKYCDQVTLYRGFEDYTVRFPFDEGTAIIRIVVTPNFYDMTVAEENSALKMSQSIPSFTVGITANDDGLRFWKTPKDSRAIEWLNRKSILHGMPSVHTRAEHLMAIATISEMVWSLFIPIMEKSVQNDTTYYSFGKGFRQTADEFLAHKLVEERKEKLLDGWDTVSITTNQYLKIYEVTNTNHFEYDINNIALTRFCLALFDGKSTAHYFYEMKGRTLTCGVTDCETFVTKWFDVNLNGQNATEIDATLHVTDEIAKKWCLEHPSDDEDATNWGWCANAFFLINAFMANVGDVAMEVETKEAVAPSEGRQSKHASRNSVRLFKCYHLIKGWKSKAKKKIEITCPCWGVRGHFRHYKNGKVVFISPYVKGKEKEAYKGKDYSLLPYKDA